MSAPGFHCANCGAFNVGGGVTPCIFCGNTYVLASVDQINRIKELETKLDAEQRATHDMERLYRKERQRGHDLQEQVAALQSREVCTRHHDGDVETCGYCQRDEALTRLDRYREALEYIVGSSEPGDEPQPKGMAQTAREALSNE